MRRKNCTPSLPASVQPYFQYWIRIDTWHTKHMSDLENFYKFVWAVDRYCRPNKGAKKSKRRLPSDWEIYNHIIAARRGSFDAKHLKKEAEYFSSLYNHLLHFANTPNCPDHLVEKKDIFMYHHQLEWELGGCAADPERVSSAMARVWGQDWKQRLEKERSRL